LAWRWHVLADPNDEHAAIEWDIGPVDPDPLNGIGKHRATLSQ
jgi:hypothetical protein